jgi:cytochrome P450
VSVEVTEPAEPEGNPFAQMDPEMAANPQPLFKAIRETDPVMAVEGVGVVLARKAEIDEAFRHPEIFSSNMSAIDLKNIRPLIPLQIDPPDHKQYRKILDPIFAPRQMALLDDSLTQLVNDLIDRFGDREEVDFAGEFSIPFPSQVFLTLLGLPLDDLPRFLAMKDGIIRPDQASGEPWGSEGMHDHQRATAQSIYDYFDEVLDERTEQRQDDLLSRFLDTEVDGQTLTREDILDICFLFLIAGLDTVTATLDCMFGYLTQHPERRQQIVDDPSVIPTAIEELLRWETPVMGVARVAVQDANLGGCPIHEGDQVMIMLGSANTDEAEFGDADTVRFDRDTNRHLAFGGGIHRCLGSHLARQELRVALREWHRRIPQYSIAPGASLTYTSGIRSIDHFPMRLHA